MRTFLTLLVTATLAGGGPAFADAPIEVKFKDHLEVGLNELDVFVARTGKPAEAVRVTPKTKSQRLDDPICASADPVHHNPFDQEAVGPHPKGRPLGMALAGWLAADGTARITCHDGRGTVEAEFSDLVPNGVYTMWHSFVPRPPTEPFGDVLDMPLGARDGSQARFTANEKGNAVYRAAFERCLQLSGRQAMTTLAIAWHSDGKTYGTMPGSFGSVSHVQLFAVLPQPSQINDQ